MCINSNTVSDSTKGRVDNTTVLEISRHGTSQVYGLQEKRCGRRPLIDAKCIKHVNSKDHKCYTSVIEQLSVAAGHIVSPTSLYEYIGPLRLAGSKPAFTTARHLVALSPTLLYLTPLHTACLNFVSLAYLLWR